MNGTPEDYYRVIEELDPDLNREQNYQNLRDALAKWSKRSGTAKAKQMELKIKDVLHIFESEQSYAEYHSSLLLYYKERLAQLVNIAVIDGKLSPKKRAVVIQQGTSVLSLNSNRVERLLNEVLSEQGIKVGEPLGTAAFNIEDWMNDVQQRAVKLLETTSTKIKESPVFKDFQGSYRVLLSLVALGAFVLLVQITIGAMALVWILLASALVYFALKRRW